MRPGGGPKPSAPAVSVTLVVSIPSVVRGVTDPWATGPIEEELVRRRARLVADLTGTVVVVTGDGPSSGAAAGAADHVVSLARLATVDDVPGEIDRLVGLLRPDGWLHVVEPSLGGGPTGRAQHLAATVARDRTGWRIDRDVPAALRSRGLVITDLERFSMPVPSVVLRPWVAGRARRRRPLPTQETER